MPVRIFCLIIIFLSNPVFARDYYISKNPQAGELSISQVNAVACFDHGDKVLFKREQTFWGVKLDFKACADAVNGGTLEVGAYGIGAPPKLSGAITPLDLNLKWQRAVNIKIHDKLVSRLSSAPIFKIGPISKEMTGFTYANQAMDFAKFPDSLLDSRNPNYLKIKTSYTKAQGCGMETCLRITNPADLNSDPMWSYRHYGTETNSYAIVRTTDWSAHKARVSWVHSSLPSFASWDRLTFPETGNKMDIDGMGIILYGSLDFLTRPGEWYYSPSDKHLYYWPINGTKPKENLSSFILKSTDAIINANLGDKMSIVIHGINVHDSSDNGIKIVNAKSVVVKNTRIVRAMTHGLNILNISGDVRVSNSSFLRNSSNGIQASKIRGTLKVYGSAFADNGYFTPFTGLGMNFNSLRTANLYALSVAGSTFKRSGYAHILTGPAEHSIYVGQNQFWDHCLLLNDCGAFYINSEKQTLKKRQWIIQNEFYYGRGNFRGTRKSKNLSPAVYLDFSGHHFTIYENQIYDSISDLGGIFLNGGYGNNIHSNIFFLRTKLPLHIGLGRFYRDANLNENNVFNNSVVDSNKVERAAIYNYSR